jgi:energy-converting hydrogenase Eha subunit A
MHLVLFRVIAQIEVTAANIGNAIDALTSGLPRIYDNSVLQFVWFPTATTATTITGQYIETQG